jgi:hypothetical protein
VIRGGAGVTCRLVLSPPAGQRHELLSRRSDRDSSGLIRSVEREALRHTVLQRDQCIGYAAQGGETQQIKHRPLDEKVLAKAPGARAIRRRPAVFERGDLSGSQSGLARAEIRGAFFLQKVFMGGEIGAEALLGVEEATIDAQGILLARDEAHELIRTLTQDGRKSVPAGGNVQSKVPVGVVIVPRGDAVRAASCFTLSLSKGLRPERKTTVRFSQGLLDQCACELLSIEREDNIDASRCWFPFTESSAPPVVVRVPGVVAYTRPPLGAALAPADANQIILQPLSVATRSRGQKILQSTTPQTITNS